MKRIHWVTIVLFCCLLLTGAVTALVHTSKSPQQPSVRIPDHASKPDVVPSHTVPASNAVGSYSQHKSLVADPGPSRGAAQSKGETIVRFDSLAAQRDFITRNSLLATDVTPVEQLGVYRVGRTQLHATRGSEVFTSNHYSALLAPTDTYYSTQWYLGKVGAPPTWNNTLGNPSNIVAVIDTGFALTHEDLDNKWAINSGESGPTTSEGEAPNCTSRGLVLDKSCNNLDDDNDGYVDNRLGWDFTGSDNSVQVGETNPSSTSAFHATAVSGLIAAESSNNQGVTGMSWDSQLLPLQALSDDGNGDTISVALAIHYAVTHAAKVINLSLGSSDNDPLVAEQVQYALDSGVVVVAAAGNDGGGQLAYPANYPGVIAVGASDSVDNRASFSNYGSNLALVAPGTSSICSTGWTVARPSDYYACGYSGTSFSSPIVAGAAALLLSENPSLSPTQVKTALTTTAVKVPGMAGQSYTTRYGYGRLDVYAALTNVALPTPRGSCTSHLLGAKCEIRAINTRTNEVMPFGLSDLETAASTYSLARASLSASNSWLLQQRVVVSGRYSLVKEEGIDAHN